MKEEHDALSTEVCDTLVERMGRLKQVGTYEGGGLWRQPFTEADREAKGLLTEWMTAAGMRVWEDNAGNLFGRLEGIEPGPVIMTGSHIDSVKAGGHLDGAIGILTGLAATSELGRKHGQPKKSIEVVALCGEEQSRYRIPFLGSRGMLGLLSAEELEIRDAEGVPLAQAMRDFGLDPDDLASARRTDIGAFVELHIEQGPVLENEGLSTAVVTDIVGITQKEYSILGEANHGGTTPMHLRRDALRAGAQVMARVPEICRSAADTAVATIGVVEVKPGAVSNIPSSATFSLDIRDPKQDIRSRILSEIHRTVEQVCLEENVGFTEKVHTDIDPVAMDSAICDILIQEARDGKISCKAMHSGAGHDAMIFAREIPSAMIFIASKGGKSHTPEEDTDLADILQGVSLLYRGLRRLGNPA